MTQKELDIYEQAIKTYGYNAQRLMLIEEIGELLNAIAKLPRGRASVDDVIEELADVSIMINQMAFYWGWSVFHTRKAMKIQRLEERLNKHK